MYLKSTIDNIYTLLSTSAALTARIKFFGRGNLDKSHIIFPFISIGAPSDIVNAQTIGKGGSDEHTMNLPIYVGHRSRVDEEAFNEMLQSLDDITDICRGEYFSNSLTRPANILTVRTGYEIMSGEFLWIGEVMIEGRRKEPRLKP